MDLGYKRDTFDSKLRETDRQMTDLRGQQLCFLAKNQDSREREKLFLAQSAKYLFVIVSDRNISSVRFKRIEECASSLCNVGLYVLTRECHPNEDHLPPETIMKRIKIRGEAFQDLESNIEQAIL